MPELRFDPLTGHRVIISRKRAKRPMAVEAAQGGGAGSVCPFCEGNEFETPGEVDASRPDGSAPDRPGWSVRVVPNKYPALDTIEGPAKFEPLAKCLPGLGAHEVIIETPRHVASWTELSVAEIQGVLAMYQSRLRYWREHSDLKYAILFKNLGHSAGASQYHAHSQLLVLPLIPDQVAREHAAALRLFEENGQCAYCATSQRELQESERMVAESDSFIAFCPFVSRLAHQVRVLPRHHQSRFCALDEQGRAELARFLRDLLMRLETVLPNAAYNFWVHTLPLSSLDENHFHWHIEILPRHSMIAGFEWNTGWTINAIPPEQAASQLRNVAG